jgi:flagellin-like hook-associated protein FlgL
LYSAYKEWLLIGDNTKYQLALSAIGGDPIGPGRFLGTTFFLENGWKIRPFEGNHALTVTGNLYTRDGSSPFVPTLGTFNVLINTTTSNLVDTISTGGGGSVDNTAIATAVWNRTSSGSTAGSYGALVNTINTNLNTVDSNIDTLLTQTSAISGSLITLQSTLDLTKTAVDLANTNIDEILDWTVTADIALGGINTNIDVSEVLIREMTRYLSNRTRIDESAKTMTIFNDDGVTPWRVFSLRNFNGNGSVTEVAERVPI